MDDELMGDSVGESSFKAKIAGTRHERPEAFAARIHAWMQTWTCLWCKKPNPGRMFCSEACREASRLHEAEPWMKKNAKAGIL